MKKNLFMAGALVAALTVVTGCSNEDLATDNGNARDERVGGITEITASTPNENPNTRLVYEHLSVGGLKVNWKAYDATAPEQFYMKTFANGNAFSYLSSQKPEATTQTSNCFFDIQICDNGVWDPSVELWAGDEAHAIYPVKDYGGEFLKDGYSASSVTIDLPLAAQTGKLADMKDFDYMTATGTVGTVKSNTVEEGGSAFKLNFKHRVAVLCLKGLTFEGLTENASISSFSFSGTGVKPSAKLTMASGVMTDVIGFSSINDAAITTAASTFAITGGKQTENAYICFFPNGDMTGQQMTVSATVGSDTYSATFTAPTFVEGNMYTATVTMKKKEAAITWATGNLVADGPNGAKIGAPTDGGLYFQFGSLVGWAGGATGDGTGAGVDGLAPVIKVKPSNLNSANEAWAAAGKIWQATTGTVPLTVAGSGSADEIAGIGDPCRYYLKGTWRLPTIAEYITLFDLATTEDWINGWSWTDSPASATHTDGLTFPASGYRRNSNGKLLNAGTGGNYWSALPFVGAAGRYLEFFSSYRMLNNNARPCGMPVRCVQNAL